MLPEEDLPPPPRSRRRLWVGLGVLLLVLSLAAGPTYRQAKVWQARRLLRQSTAEAAAGHWPEAWENAQAAWQLAPRLPEVARSRARLLDRLQPTQAVPAWREVVALSAGHPEDRLALAESALRVGSLEEVATQLEALSAALPGDPRVVDLRARWHWQAQRPAEALDTLRTLVQDPSARPAETLRFAQWARLSPDPAVRQEGRDLLWRWVRLPGADPPWTLLLPALSSDPDLTPAQIEELVVRLEAPARAQRDLALGQAELRGRLPGADPDVLLRALLPRFSLDQPEERLALGRWLNRQHWSAQALQVVPLDLALTRKDLLLVHLDALAMLDRWTAVAGLLARPRIPLEPYLVSFFTLRTHLEKGESRAAQVAWERTLLACQNDPERLVYLVEKTRLLQQPAFTRAALRALAQLPAHRRAALGDLLRLEQSLGETRRLREVYAALLRLSPEEPALRGDHAYLGFLLGEDLPEALRQARAVAEANSRYLSFRATLAFGLWRTGQLAEALTWLDLPGLAWDSAQPRWRLIRALLLREAGRLEESLALARALPTESLLPEEIDLWHLAVTPPPLKPTPPLALPAAPASSTPAPPPPP